MRTILKFLASTLLLFAAVLVMGSGAYALSMTATPALPDTDTSVHLNWSAVSGATSYQIYRDDTVTPIETINIATSLYSTSYTDTGLVPETTYDYYVYAYSGVTLLDTDYSAEVTTSSMLAPTGLQAVYDINLKTATLAWTDESDATNGNSAFIYDGSFYVELIDVAYAEAAAVVNNVTDTTQFWVDAYYDLDTRSDLSNSVTVAPIDEPTINATVTDGRVTVSWDSFSQLSSFYLERAYWNGASWEDWMTINTSLTGISAADMPTTGGSYKYRLTGKATSTYPYSGHSDETGIVYIPVITASITSPTTVLLSWDLAAGNNISGYRIDRGTSPTSLSTVTTVLSAVSSYTDTLVIASGTTYYYRLAAYDSSSGYSYSAMISVSASTPAAPSSLTATVESSDSVILNWIDNSSNEVGFYLERMEGTGNYTVLATPGAGVTTYTDGTVAIGTSYTYRIRAYNLMGNSTYSGTVAATASTSVAPASLTATAVSSSQVTLAWTYKDISSFSTIIERKAGESGTWARIATTSYGVLKHTDSGLSPDTQYYYRVRKYVSSNVTTVPYPNNDTGVGALTRLTTPSLTVSASLANMMLLSWYGNTSSADVIIERKLSSGSFAVMNTASSATSIWYDTTGLIAQAVYTYRIKLKTINNESAYSTEVSAAYNYLTAPSGLKAEAFDTESGLALEEGGDDPDSIKLNWTDNSNNESGFEVWRRPYGASSFALYGTLGKNVTTFTDTKVQSGIQYYYQVRGYITSINLYSTYSETASAGIDILQPPTDLQYTYVSSASATLAWKDNSTNETYFKVERKIGPDSDWTTIITLSSNTTSYTVTNLNTNYLYTYRIRAYSSIGGFDSFSNEVEVSTSIPKAPDDLTAVAVSSTQINLSWEDTSENETFFRIMRKAANSTVFLSLTDTLKDVTSYNDRSVAQGTKYSYKVLAYNKAGHSESGVATATTTKSGTFSDVPSSFWARAAIENLAGRGVISGKSSTTFAPGDKITRAEFTVLIIRAFKLDTVPTGTMTDVKTGSWYYNPVMVAENLGIISGDEYGKFYPNRYITREEMAVIIVRTLNAVGKGLEGYSNTVLEDFWDSSLISPYALSSMATVVGNGVMQGLPGGVIASKSTSTRAEAATVIYRIIDR